MQVIDHQLRARHNHSLRDLKQILVQEWNNIGQRYIWNLKQRRAQGGRIYYWILCYYNLY